jgi:hypothetical protein
LPLKKEEPKGRAPSTRNKPFVYLAAPDPARLLLDGRSKGQPMLFLAGLLVMSFSGKIHSVTQQFIICKYQNHWEDLVKQMAGSD